MTEKKDKRKLKKGDELRGKKGKYSMYVKGVKSFVEKSEKYVITEV